MTNGSKAFLLVVIALHLQCSNRDAGKDGEVHSWMSKVNAANTGMEYGLSPQPVIALAKKSADSVKYVIRIEDDKQYQEMDGFGASYTEASAYLMIEKLTDEQRKDLVRKLFDKDQGIGISMLRQPVGASDHVLGQYDYASVPRDYSLEHFDISHDTLYKIPIIRQSLAVHPGRVRLSCATWSPPAWMKTNNDFIGKAGGIEGHLRPDCYDAYALYLVKFIKAYAAHGIEVYATSIQNEPDHPSDYWPAMKMTSAEQAKFIRDHLAPLLRKEGMDTRIFCWDHNFDTDGYPMGKFAADILGDTSVSKYVAGSAWHWYSGGFPEAILKTQQQFPDKEIHFTEGSGGEWDPVRHWRDGFLTEMYYVVNLPRAHVKSIVWWNIALDENHGPDYYYQTIGSNSACRGLVTVDKSTGEVTYNVDYYTMGHISKFVDPGAKRIQTNQWDKELENVAFLNPDESLVLIAFNPTAEPKVFKATWNELTFTDTIAAEAAKTYTWNTVLN